MRYIENFQVFYLDLFQSLRGLKYFKFDIHFLIRCQRR